MQSTHRYPGAVVGMRGALQYDRVITGKGGTAEGEGGMAERTLHGDTDCRTELAVQFGRALKPGKAPAVGESARKEPKQAAAESTPEISKEAGSSAQAEFDRKNK